MAAHRLTSDEDYAAACARCEIWVDLTEEEDRDQLLAHLRYDRRKVGSHGRALTANVPKFGLRVHDRLEPCDELQDVSKLESISLPARILFWRIAYQSACTHRCPLFSSALGITPNKTIALDLLHTLFLGPMLSWCRLVLWELLLSSIWGVTQPTEAEKLEVGLLMVNAELVRWYSKHDRANPHNKSPASPNSRRRWSAPKMIASSS